MATARHKGIWSDDSGAVILEMTVTITLFLVVLFGTVEGGHLFYQWNVATKATQLGARIAAVSVPVASNLAVLTGMEEGDQPGEPVLDNYFNCECKYVSGSPTCQDDPINPPLQSCGTFGTAAMNAIVFGRGDAALGCGSPASVLQMGMCDVFTRILPQNVIVRYQYTGLGYAGRPGGMVPTITVSLTELTFDWVALSGLLGLGPITIPGLRTTITGEDLRQGS